MTWFPSLDERLITTAALAVTLYVLVRVIEWGMRRGIRDARWQYISHKIVRYSALAVFLISAVGIWARHLQGMLLIMGATGAGLAIALAPVIVSLAGWGLITWAGLYQVGDRVQIGEVIGDVVDIGILRTTLLEIGNWVGGDQLTGRTAVIANAAVFKDPIFNYTKGAPYIWDEFTVPITYGPNWKQAQDVILASVHAYMTDTEPAARTALGNLPGVSLVGLPETRAQVFVSLTEHWVACTLRYIVHARSRRTVKHQLQTRVLHALAQKGIEIASPALTVVRYPAERTWREESL